MRRLLIVSMGLLLAACGPQESRPDDAEHADAPVSSQVEHEGAKDEKPSPRPSLPEVGTLAPDFELARLSGERVKLAGACGQRPTVLVFGSLS